MVLSGSKWVWFLVGMVLCDSYWFLVGMVPHLVAGPTVLVWFWVVVVQVLKRIVVVERLRQVLIGD